MLHPYQSSQSDDASAFVRSPRTGEFSRGPYSGLTPPSAGWETEEEEETTAWFHKNYQSYCPIFIKHINMKAKRLSINPHHWVTSQSAHFLTLKVMDFSSSNHPAVCYHDTQSTKHLGPTESKEASTALFQGEDVSCLSRTRWLSQ